MTATTLSNNTLVSSNAGRATDAPGFGVQIWNALTRLGALRAASQMRQMARQYDTTRPELSRMLRDAARTGLNG